MNQSWAPDAKPRKDDEAKLQAAIIQHLKLLAAPNVIYYAIPNGEHRSKRTGARLKAQGVLKGAPDLALILADGRPAFIEIKTQTGRLSPEQRLFQDKCHRMEIEHVVVRSIDGALSALRAWGCIPEEID